MIVKSSFRRINIFSPEEICNFKFLVGFQTYFSYIVKHSWKLLEMAQSPVGFPRPHPRSNSVCQIYQ